MLLQGGIFFYCESTHCYVQRSTHKKDLSWNGKKKHAGKPQPRDHGVRSGQRFASISSAKTATTQRELKDFSVRKCNGEVCTMQAASHKQPPETVASGKNCLKMSVLFEEVFFAPLLMCLFFVARCAGNILCPYQSVSVFAFSQKLIQLGEFSTESK